MKRLCLGTAAALSALTLPVLAWADAGGEGAYGHGHMWGGWGGWVVGPVMMILFAALTVAVVVLVVRWLGGMGGGPARGPKPSAALDILEERFARGEIDKDEFEARRQSLQGKSPG